MDFNELAKHALSGKDIDVVADKEKNAIWVLHATPFHRQDSLVEAHYHEGDYTLTFVAEDEYEQKLDIVIQEPLRPVFDVAEELNTFLVDKDHNITDVQTMPLKRLNDKTTAD